VLPPRHPERYLSSRKEEMMSALAEHIEGLRKALEALPFPLPPSIPAGDWRMIKLIPKQGEIRLRVVSSEEEELTLPLPAGASVPCFSVPKEESGLWVGDGRLYARPGFAFFQGKVGEELGETLRMVRVLRPLFCALELADLEGALEALAGFEGEEARSYGPYVLAWSGNPEEPAFLRKGSVFGDHLLDGALLTGREVVLRYPRVKVTLEGRVSERDFKTLFKMSRLTFEWEGEEATFVGGLSEGYLSCDLVLEERPGACLIRKGAEAILRKDFSLRKDPLFSKLHQKWLLTPKMRVFLETLVEEAQDPLGALGDEDFFRQVMLRLLSLF
jgi:hypothetical protein